MHDFMADGLFLPALIMAAMGFIVPRLWAHALPEGVVPLMVNAFLSTVLLFALAACFFVGLYVWQGMPFAEIMAPGWAKNIMLGRLGQPEDVAGVVSFLASKDAAFLTAETIQIGGGQALGI